MEGTQIFNEINLEGTEKLNEKYRGPKYLTKIVWRGPKYLTKTISFDDRFIRMMGRRTERCCGITSINLQSATTTSWPLRVRLLYQ